MAKRKPKKGKPNWSKIGRASRAKGIRNERKTALVLEDMFDVGEWERTPHGRRQIQGDLMPSDPNQHTHFYIESKAYAMYNRNKIDAWWKDAVRKAQHDIPDTGRWVILLCHVAGGLVIVRRKRVYDDDKAEKCHGDIVLY